MTLEEIGYVGTFSLEFTHMSSVTVRAGVLNANRLALLYQHILTAIVRMQAGKQSLSDLETFRRRIKGALQQAESEAAQAGYDGDTIREASFAVVALLDETILSPKGPSADEWQRWPLNIELFGQAIAGDVFFDRLLDIERRPDSPQRIDVLEVYLICLLLGFEGRYAPPLRGEAYRIMDRLRRRIETARGSDYRLAPQLEIRTELPVVPPETSGGRRWHSMAAGAVLAALLLFLVYSLHLTARVSDLRIATDSMR
jgi:type VI secretion system protein ImpK